jgi:hypothetical protein
LCAASFIVINCKKENNEENHQRRSSALTKSYFDGKKCLDPLVQPTKWSQTSTTSQFEMTASFRKNQLAFNCNKYQTTLDEVKVFNLPLKKKTVMKL